MVEQTPATLVEEAARLNLLPAEAAPPYQAALYQAALSNLDLPIVDYQLVRDLVCMARLESEGALEAGLIALLVARYEGSLCLRLNADSVARRLPEFEGRAELCAGFLKNLESGHYDAALVGRDAAAFRPLAVMGGGLYFQRALQDEAALRRGYQARLQPQPSVSEDELARFHDCMQQVLAAPASGVALQLNPKQQCALGLALLQRFTVVTGGPGTGKTSIVRALLRCLVRLGVPTERIALAAPTGRAAQRMKESLQSGRPPVGESTPDELTPDELALDTLKGQTLHGLLGYSPSRHSFTFGADNPLDLDVLIVDEVSMVDSTLMARLLDAVPVTTRLVLLGDVHQLPSVEAGAVLADLVPPGSSPCYSAGMVEKLGRLLPQPPVATEGTRTPASAMTDHVVQLVHDYRSAPQIQKLAKYVKEFSEESAEQLLALVLPGDETCRLQEDALSGPAYFGALDAWAEQHYLSAHYRSAVRYEVSTDVTITKSSSELKAVLGYLTRARILSTVHQGFRGCVSINEYLSRHLRRQLEPDGRDTYFVGQPVMVTSNDHARQLFNGDTGLVLRDSKGQLRVVFPRGEGALLVPVHNLPPHATAFAITVHKSQGSEFDKVLLILPTENESARTQRLLSRQILYTALTRARHSITVNAPRSVLLQACRNVVQRDSGLNL